MIMSEEHECNSKNCKAHVGMVSDVKTNKAMLVVWGLLASILLLWLVAIARNGEDEIHAHKEVALKRYSQIEKTASERYSKLELEVSSLRGVVNLTNNNLEHIQGDMAEMLDIIKNNKGIFAEGPLDSSILMVRDFE